MHFKNMEKLVKFPYINSSKLTFGELFYIITIWGNIEAKTKVSKKTCFSDKLSTN